MKYVLLGQLNPECIQEKDRVKESKAAMKKLGIKLESVLYTQGPYDFVDVVSTEDPQAMVAFSVWYMTQNYGSFVTLPAFSPEEFDACLKKLD